MSARFRAGLAGALIAAAVTLPGLGAGTLWDNSETAYGEVAREVLLLGDPVVLHLNLSPWFVQPPLFFWIAALFAHLLGISTLSLRLTSALATIAMGALTAALLCDVAGRRAALYATLVLSTGLMQAVLGRLAVMDALLDLLVASALLLWFRALVFRDRVAFVAGWGCAAFGVLTKGPVAIVVPVLVIGCWCFFERRRTALCWPSLRSWLAAAALFAAITLPWFIALAHREGAPAVAQLIGHYSVGRYVGTIENQAGPVWYYLPVLLLGFFPWVAFLPAAALHVTRARSAIGNFALSWGLVVFVFFSLAKTKLPNYIALELPALAILCGLYLDSVALRFRRSAWIAACGVLLATALLALAVRIFTRSNSLSTDISFITLPLVVLLVLIVVGTIAAVLAFASRRYANLGPFLIGAAMTGSIAILALAILPQLERFKPVPVLAAFIEARRLPGDRVALEGMPGGNALAFYTRPPVYTIAVPGFPLGSGGLPARDVLCGAPRVFVVTPKRRPAIDPVFGRWRRVVARSDKALVFLYDGPDCKGTRR